MDCSPKQHQYSAAYFIISFIYLVLLSFITADCANAGYFQLHNIMSAAEKNVPNHLLLNDAKLNLQIREKNTGHVVNTLFANDGGMAGCGVTSTLMQYMYGNSGTIDLSKNYIALNVFSQVMGYDPQAPFWGNPEGQVKGYLTQGSVPTNIAYPYTPYHRVLPSLYPAYLGLYNNGLNCGRFMEANFDKQFCEDRTSPSGISKFCPNVPSLSYTGQKLQGYIFDSCEDNNGWCRDDEAHIDVNTSALSPAANYYLQWKFIKNPYYADPKAPTWLKDIWLGWFGQASKYWSYVTVLNAENGTANVKYNIGSNSNPTWINSHVLAGDNNITWSSTSNNGQLWQVEPINALTDTAPPDNPFYQIRLFDYLGYPTNQGAIYQFRLLFEDGSLGQNIGSYYLFYQGGLRVKPGTQAQNMTILKAPTGVGKITINFANLLPSNVSLDSTKPNYLRPVLISEAGYAWDPDPCINNQCVFSKLPTQGNFYVFAHYIEDVSNDLTMRKVNDIAIHTANFFFPIGSTSINYALKANEINLSTLYSARLRIPLRFSTNSRTPINGNLQALIVPDNSKNAANNITAQTQGCFLNTYVNFVITGQHKVTDYFGNHTICTVYYTVNHQSNFSSTPPTAYFDLILARNAGFSPVNYYLSAPYHYPIQVRGYNPGATSPPAQLMPLASYLKGSGGARSFYLILDPASDTDCLKNLDKTTGVSVKVDSAAPINLTKADIPIETQLTQPASSISMQVNLIPDAKNLSCQAMSAIQPTPANPLLPGIDVVNVIKLFAIPKSEPATSGIAAIATGDAACFGGADNLQFSQNGVFVASAPYSPKPTSTNIDVKVLPGTYLISDNPFNVVGGKCQLSHTPSVTIQKNTYTPVTLNYRFTPTPGGTCTAVPKILGSWPNGCTIQFSISSPSSLKNVTLAWQKGLYDWSHAQVWGGQGNLAIPPNPTDKVIWLLPSWVNGQGQVVGMNVNNDSMPSICEAFNKQAINVQCGGLV